MSIDRPFRPAQPAAGAPAQGAATGDAVMLEVHLRQALVESRQRYKDLVEISSDFAWETRADGSFAFVSPKGALGYAAKALVDRPARSFLVARLDNGPQPFETRVPLEETEFAFRRADGGVAILHAAAVPLVDESGAWRGARGICRDVTEARARDAALAQARRRERLLAEIVTAIRDVVEPADMLAVAVEAAMRALGAAGCQVFRHAPERGFKLAAAAGASAPPLDPARPLPVSLDAPEGHVLVKDRLLVAVARYRHAANGLLCLWRGSDAPIWEEEDTQLAAAIASQLGIAIEQIANHEALERLSCTDPLTGLFNRRGFFDRLERRLARLKRDGDTAALVYVDLDNFKPVNDRFGHQRGDALLTTVAGLLRRGTRPADLIGRLGGDEFALWLEGVDGAGARGRAELLLELAGELRPFSATEQRPLGFSIGVALYNGHGGEDLAALTARADAAMYAVKHGSKGGFRFAPALTAESA